MLEVDGVKVAQTGSILRYISRASGKDAVNPLNAARADSAFEATQAIALSQIFVAVNLMEEAQARAAAAKFKAALPQSLKNWHRLLGDAAFFHGVCNPSSVQMSLLIP